MKITMKTSEEKTVSGGGCNNPNSTNAKIRIAIFGQHEVGKSALTVRYLTRRYIGEYKSNTDMLYRQTLTVSHGSCLDIEIVDISTSEDANAESERKTFPLEEMQRADGYIIVYSITDRSSFTFAMETLSTLSNYYNNPNPTASRTSNNHTASSSSPSPAGVIPNNSSTTTTTTATSSSPQQPKQNCPVVLLANKNDLEHLRVVEKVEGLSAAMQFGCHFYELSVAENSPEVYQSFQTIISSFSSYNQSNHQTAKRKFSVSKMFGNLRLGRTSPSQQVISQASIVDLSGSNSNSSSSNSSNSSCSSSSNNSSIESYYHPSDYYSSTSNSNSKNHSNRHSGSENSCSSSNSSSSSSNNLSSSFCHLKSKLVEFHSMKKRHNSPPICSL